MTGKTKGVVGEPLTTASNDDLLAMLASINELLKLTARARGHMLTIDKDAII
jgi:hypothetical protein